METVMWQTGYRWHVLNHWMNRILGRLMNEEHEDLKGQCLYHSGLNTAICVLRKNFNLLITVLVIVIGGLYAYQWANYTKIKSVETGVAVLRTQFVDLQRHIEILHGTSNSSFDPFQSMCK